MMGLPSAEKIMIVGPTMWTQSTSVTDGRTDGQTDRQTLRSQRPCNAERRTVKNGVYKDSNRCVQLFLHLFEFSRHGALTEVQHMKTVHLQPVTEKWHKTNIGSYKTTGYKRHSRFCLQTTQSFLFKRPIFLEFFLVIPVPESSTNFSEFLKQHIFQTGCHADTMLQNNNYVKIICRPILSV